MVSDLFKISRVAFQASFLTGIWPLISPIAILSLTASCTFGYQEPPEEVGLDDSQVGAEVRIYGENPATWSPTGGEIYDYDSDSWIPTIQSDQPIVLEDSDGIHWRVELNGRPIEGRFERPVSPQQPYRFHRRIDFLPQAATCACPRLQLDLLLIAKRILEFLPRSKANVDQTRCSCDWNTIGARSLDLSANHPVESAVAGRRSGARVGRSNCFDRRSGC